ncbi:hypothetical protein GCM10023175_50300 [Pseudonocardia xishanensis]|uniref:Crotonobetainyl-CoA:carnitine CoA-transferase CaiB-like acyl-CoA transferase n=1 Tax=Pseudonocardia xishanensis TaxID=630995 RepID=A0ABP8S012_9PSEU
MEVADERAEYVGLMLRSLGAEVVKIEPPGGSPTRGIGPFVDDRPDPEQSLHFWSYNRGKQSIILDPGDAGDRAALRTLLASCDVLVDGAGALTAEYLGLTTDEIVDHYPALVHARMTDFGDDGPWSHFLGSDLVHLALGGPMSNCGYDPDPDGHYGLAPMAPQLWHSYHIAGDQLVMGILAALLHRDRGGSGQLVSCAIHEAVAKNTELDLMNWVMRRAEMLRQTARHAAEQVTVSPTIAHTQDGRWFTMTLLGQKDHRALAAFLDDHGIPHDIAREATTKEVGRQIPGSGGADPMAAARAADGLQRMARKYTYADFPWRDAQKVGLVCAPVRKPHENLADEHWQARGTFARAEHPALGRSVPYPVSKWVSNVTGWSTGGWSPRLGEHQDTALGRSVRPAVTTPRGVVPATRPSRRGLPLPLEGVRILDFSWFLASAGATRFLSALGAESLKVEWAAHPDTRLGAMAPVGGRAARAAATGPLQGVTDPDMGGQFNNKNAGKRGLSLNVRDPRGLDIARRLVSISDIVAEGFSPGVMKRWGLGYDELCEIRPDIIYAQQSGAGELGTFGRLRVVGPIAAALSGATEMSGLPEPAMPAGWGYSYLDWIGAYSFATAMLAALYHRDRTGEGQWIDSSQVETGIFLTGVPLLDWDVNGRAWQRTGNRSPLKPAAPHGAYRAAGKDRWIAIACFDDEEWARLAGQVGEEWTRDPRFATLASRLAHQDELDDLMTGWTSTQDAYQLMYRLQTAGVRAGVCQTAADRCERDPQLDHLQWLTELAGTKIGTWPVPEMPIKMSATPPYIGGYLDRGAPNYGEDNEYVLGELLGFATRHIKELADDGVI